MKLQLVTEIQGWYFLDCAEQWYKHARSMWDSGFAVKSAIAEYLANENGLTLYKNFAGKEI